MVKRFKVRGFYSLQIEEIFKRKLLIKSSNFRSFMRWVPLSVALLVPLMVRLIRVPPLSVRRSPDSSVPFGAPFGGGCRGRTENEKGTRERHSQERRSYPVTTVDD